jgi:hypothetical protein
MEGHYFFLFVNWQIFNNKIIQGSGHFFAKASRWFLKKIKKEAYYELF